MLSLRLSKGLSLVMFHVTHTSWGFLWIFCRRFIVFSILFLFSFIEFYYWSLSWDSLFYCFAFCGNDFYCGSTDWLLHDAGPGCEESRNILQKALLFTVTTEMCSLGKLFRFFVSVFWENLVGLTCFYWVLTLLILGYFTGIFRRVFYLVYREFLSWTSFYIFCF